ncbi:hypothetical protein OAV62_02350, partial [bacterium]|nr:hypothetical protein [bacterium]
GKGTLFGTLQGNTRRVLYKFSVDLPRKHNNGGQSALRFARIRLEKRQNYVRKVTEIATQLFISDDKPNVTGIVLAGSAEFKAKLNGSTLFDQRLVPLVVKMVDVHYGGENGFNQAIELSQDALQNVRFVAEKKLLSKYFSEISRDTGRYCFGTRDTLYAMENGAVGTLLIWENLPLIRFELKNNSSGETSVVHLSPDQVTDKSFFTDEKSGVDLEIIDEIEMIDWITINYKRYGVKLEFVTDRSQDGSQFVKGFGGIGGILRYSLDFTVLDDMEEDLDEFFDEDGFM